MTADRSAEETTERLACTSPVTEMVDIGGHLGERDCGRCVPCLVRDAIEALPADQLAELLAGRPIEERARIAGLMPVVPASIDFPSKQPTAFVERRVAIPEEET